MEKITFTQADVSFRKKVKMGKLESVMRFHDITGKHLAHVCCEIANNSDNLEEAGIWASGISRLKNGGLKKSKVFTLRRIVQAINKITNLNYTIDEIDDEAVVVNKKNSAVIKSE